MFITGRAWIRSRIIPGNGKSILRGGKALPRAELHSCRWRLADAGALFDGDGDLLDDFEAEAFQGGDVHGGVREQADALDS